VVKRNAIEVERFIKESMKGEEGFSGVLVTKGKFYIFVNSRRLYNEIKEPFERYGFEVQCGRKPKMS
jgi:hypothetical protein